MRLARGRFEVDGGEGKLLGVCAGIARATGIDVTLVRAGIVVATLMWPWTLVAYGVAALVGRRCGRIDGRGHDRIATAEESRERMRHLDLRMQAIETCVTSSNSRLAREIEELR